MFFSPFSIHWTILFDLIIIRIMRTTITTTTIPENHEDCVVHSIKIIVLNRLKRLGLYYSPFDGKQTQNSEERKWNVAYLYAFNWKLCEHDDINSVQLFIQGSWFVSIECSNAMHATSFCQKSIWTDKYANMSQWME